MNYIIAAVIGYILGCLQTAFLIGKFILGKDIRDLGNGNAGASNATVSFGRKFGIMTAIVDILKGVAAIVIVRMIFSELESAYLWNLLYVTGFSAILGHNFPFYMQFKGGKGTATAIGMLFGMDIRLGAVALLTMVIVVLITDYITIGTISLMIVMLGYTFIFQYHWLNITLVIILTAMSLLKHRENLMDIRNGQGKSVRKALFKKK